MRQRNLVVSTSTSRGVSSGRVESQYFVGSFSPSGHSMRSHSSGWGVDSFQSREAGRTRTAAKREDKISFEPSRQETMLQRFATQQTRHHRHLALDRIAL